MAKIGLPKGSGKWLKVREKSVKSQGILKWILSGNPEGASYRSLQAATLSSAYNLYKPFRSRSGSGSKPFVTESVPERFF